MAREHQFVARDFMGLGKMRDVQEEGHSGDGGTTLKPHGADFGHMCAAATSLDKGIRLNGTAFVGSKHPLRSSGTTFQCLLSSGTLQEERLIEQSAENVPERSYLMHPCHTQGWWRGDHLIKRSPTVDHDDFGLKSQAVSGFGALPKNALSLSIPNFHSSAAILEAAQRVPATEPTEKKDSAPLTIFYGGNVNVFDDITADRAQAIMFLASTGNLNAISSAGGANPSAMSFAMTSPGMQFPTGLTKSSPMAILANINTINVPMRIQTDQGKNSLNPENGQTTLRQSGLGNANLQRLDSGHPVVPTPPPSQEQPVVPTALPQARKASLARFLEKRRERVHSKSPYSLRQADSTMDERLSSSNDIATYMPHTNTDEKKKISLPSWMERRHEYSLDMIMKEDTQIVSV